MFYGAVIRSGKPTAYVPPPERKNLHLSQASLPAGVKSDTRVSVYVKVQDEEPICVCTLTAGRLDCVPLDLFLSAYSEFSVTGDAEVHLSGYYSPEFPDEDDFMDEDEDEDDDGDMDMSALIAAARGAAGRQQAAGSSEDEDDDDDDDDEDEEDESSDEEDGHAWGGNKHPSVVIEEITDDDHKAKGDKGDNKALVVRSKGGQQQQPPQKQQQRQQQKQQANGSKPAAVAGPSSEEEDEDEEMDEDEMEDEDEEGSDDEEQPAAARAAVGKQEPGKKRKAEEAQTPSKKQATVAVAQQQKLTPKQQKALENGKAAQTPKQQQAQTPKQQDAKASQPQAAAKPEAGPSSGQKKASVRRFENGFEIHEVKMGLPNGKLAKAGKRVKVKYVGRLKKNGKVFDKSGNKPFVFRLGVGEVIKGWDKGVEGMRVGDKRKLVIPPQMGYGSQGAGRDIPPNAWLEFDVELVDVV